MRRRRVTFRALEPACETLLAGGVVAAPTESFYGLMALADRAEALERILGLKGASRDRDDPFLLLVDSRERARAYAQEIPPEAERLMDRFWPGLLTVLLKAQTGLLPAILGGRNTVGLRLDRCPVPGALVRMTDRAVTGTSANPSGRPPAADAEAVLAYFGGKVDCVVDFGPTRGLKPSTVVDISKSPFSVVREGAVPRALVSAALAPPSA
jgi:L-threonylcarbamoyladenylate synthase